ncbi:MAG: hypothetical protein RJB39_492 [Candidatus Parcubacteria bacterium]|jgi:HlyD family secretion protein
MKTVLAKTKSFFKGIWARKGQKKVWIPAVVIIIIILMGLRDGNKDTGTYVYNVAPQEFVQEVSLTGKVIAAKNVDMGFETAGRVSRVNVKVGAMVKKGQILASLENGDYTSSLNKNYALAASESARLRDIQSGSKKEDVTLTANEFENAKRELALNTQSLSDQLRDIYTKADDAIRFKVDNSFRNPRSANPEFLYYIDQNPNLRNSLNMQRLKIGEMLTIWSKDTSITNLPKIREYITATQNFINDANTGISIVSEQVGANDATYADISAKKTDIASARTAFAAAVASLNQAEIAYNNSKNAVTLAEQRLAVKTTGATTDLDIQRANVQSAQAGVQSAQAMIAKTIIRAPFDGVITKVDIKEGEIASPNTPIIGLLNDGEYQIETYVSENDIAKLVVGQIAKVSLDAYGRDVFFTATIISVDPAETIKDGVSTYRTKIQFVDKDSRIKSGMTANISIETDRRQNVLVIPQSALFLEKGIKKVYILNSAACMKETPESLGATTTPVLVPACADVLADKKEVIVVEVKTGQINNEGEIEILEGLSEGWHIIYSIKAVK